MSKIKNPRIKLPANWSPAQVRVDEHGNVQVKINPSKAGKGRFAKCVKAVEMRGGAYDPRAVCGAMEKRYRNPRHQSVMREGQKVSKQYDKARREIDRLRPLVDQLWWESSMTEPIAHRRRYQNAVKRLKSAESKLIKLSRRINELYAKGESQGRW